MWMSLANFHFNACIWILDKSKFCKARFLPLNFRSFLLKLRIYKFELNIIFFEIGVHALRTPKGLIRHAEDIHASMMVFIIMNAYLYLMPIAEKIDCSFEQKRTWLIFLRVPKVYLIYLIFYSTKKYRYIWVNIFKKRIL